MAPAELSPKAAVSSQVVVLTEDESLTPKQKAWLRFVDRVERGELVDPLGQYVAKDTKYDQATDRSRSIRPKFDAAKQHLSGRDTRLFLSGAVEAPADGSDGAITEGTGPDFCEGCDTGTGIFYPPVTTTFVSSEGVVPYSGTDNPNGYIWDLKVGYGSTQGDHYGIPNSYTVLYSDLNKGAGGDFIYIGFTRVPSDMSNNPEVRFNNPYAIGPVTKIGIVKKYYFTDSYPLISSPYFPIWVDTGRPGSYEQEDLNNNAGGWYIRSYQSKQYGATTNGQAIEVGVLSGNSDTIQPPNGWTIASSDLNEGAGGNYIYFCIKAH